MRHKMKLIAGATIVALTLVLSACGGGESSAVIEQGYGQEATQAAEYLCEEEGGVASVAAEEGGWLDYIVCKDGSVHSWEEWEE